MRRTETTFADECTRRIGRPPADLAGEVEGRILDAAARVFLERGFDAASIDLIAETARAGKPTIYARFPSKEALFEAAFLRRFAARQARLDAFRADAGDVEARLTQMGAALIEESLTADFLGLLRLAIAESRRMPELVAGLVETCRERGAQVIAHLLTEEVDAPGWTDPRDPRAVRAGRMFAELVLLPFLMRALAEGGEALRDEIETHVRERATFFLAGLRHGGV